MRAFGKRQNGGRKYIVNGSESVENWFEKKNLENHAVKVKYRLCMANGGTSSRGRG